MGIFLPFKNKFFSVSEWRDRAKEMAKNIAIIFSVRNKNKKQVLSELHIFYTKKRSRLKDLLDQDLRRS